MKRKSNQRIQRQNRGQDSKSPDLDLPLIITDIKGQKKNHNRFSLFHHDQFLIGIGSKTLIDFSVQKGVNLTPTLYQKLLSAESIHAAREKSYQYLARRDHSCLELKQKLQKKGFPLDVIHTVLHELSEKELLGDYTFASKFAKDKAILNKWGPKKIELSLLKKGVRKKIIQEILKNTFDNLSQDHICVDLIDKRKKHFLREKDQFRRKQKVYNYLAGRGFSGIDINKAITLSGITEDV